MKALVLGGNGQDGSYLTRALLSKGHDVVGADMSTEARLSHGGSYRYVCIDLRDAANLDALLEREAPDLLLQFAAVHASAGGDPYETRFGDMLAVNVKTVHTALEHARLRNAAMTLCYASSAKAFATPLPDPVDERAPRASSCLYGITKNAATDLIHYYRSAHDISGAVVWLFNHESELRPPGFFIPKLARCLAQAVRARAEGHTPEPMEFFSFDFHCDWGSAEEYCDLIVEATLNNPGEDFVLASGRSVNARSMADALFRARGLELTDHVLETKPGDPGAPTHVDISKLVRLAGRGPSHTIEELIDELVERLLASDGLR